MQPGVGQLHLGLDTGGPLDAAARRATGQVFQQRRLANARLAMHHQRPALAGADSLHQPVKHLALGVAAGQPHRASPHRQIPPRCCTVVMAPLPPLPTWVGLPTHRLAGRQSIEVQRVCRLPSRSGRAGSGSGSACSSPPGAHAAQALPLLLRSRASNSGQRLAGGLEPPRHGVGNHLVSERAQAGPRFNSIRPCVCYPWFRNAEGRELVNHGSARRAAQASASSSLPWSFPQCARAAVRRRSRLRQLASRGPWRSAVWPTAEAG
jgi:hypothetical protein